MKSQLMIILLIACAGLGFSADSAVWYKSGRGIYESDVQTIVVNPTDDAVIYAGTSRALYKSVNAGKSYRVILSPSGERGGVNDIHILSDQPEIIYAATDAGLYESFNEGESWSRIHYSSQTEGQRCFSVFFHDNIIYLGTQQGLFFRNFQEISWREIKANIYSSPVYGIVGSGNFLYFAAGETVFRWDPQTKKMESVFSAGLGGRSDLEEPSEEIRGEARETGIKSMAVSMGQGSYLFVASDTGVYVSYDGGDGWDSLSTTHLPLDDLTDLLALEKDCYDRSPECFDLLAGTRKGVFFYGKEKWMSVYKGMEASKVAGLAGSKRRTVYAATAKGIFYLPVEKALPSFNGLRDLDVSGFKDEPGISDVHQWAIDYAEVSHKKISVWRQQARRSAWLPRFNVGVDQSRNLTNSENIWGSHTGGGQHYIGPDDKTSRENLKWDVSFSWNLSDLVWSTSQTTIDSRSKMMVELRGNILNEVTRIYFERRRIQMELASNDSLEISLKMDKEMRIEELTAMIDALTGGQFSKEAQKNQGR